MKSRYGSLAASTEKTAAIPSSSDIGPEEVAGEVVLSATAVLKILKDCRENLPSLVCGHLLGLDVAAVNDDDNDDNDGGGDNDDDNGNGEGQKEEDQQKNKKNKKSTTTTSATIKGGRVVEVGDVFAAPISALEELGNGEGGSGGESGGNVDVSDGEIQNVAVSHAMAMVDALSRVGGESLPIGWYQAAHLGSALSASLVETQAAWQELNPASVLVLLDPLRTNHGTLAVSGWRLTQAALKLWKEGQFSQEAINGAGVTFQSIFERVGVRMSSSALGRGLLYQLGEDEGVESAGFERMHLGTNEFLEKNVEYMIDSLDSLAGEGSKYHSYQRAVAKQEAAMKQWLEKRRAENAARREAGKAALSEDVTEAPNHRVMYAPNRKEALLTAYQVNGYCRQVNDFAGESFAKMFLAEELN